MKNIFEKSVPFFNYVWKERNKIIIILVIHLILLNIDVFLLISKTLYFGGVHDTWAPSRHGKKTHTHGYSPESVPTLTGNTRIDRVWVWIRFSPITKSRVRIRIWDYYIRLDPEPKPVPPLKIFKIFA